MAKRKKNMILGAGEDSVTVFYTGNDSDFVEVPLKYDIRYMYSEDLINGDGEHPGIKQEIEEKIGSDNIDAYITSIFENSDNLSRLVDSSKYQHEDSSILNPDSPIVPFSKRPLNIAHWSGVFPFIEYFTYKLPDRLFRVEFNTDQGIMINEVEKTYTPLFMYGEED